MQQRLDFLDAARGAGVLLVVAAHANLLHEPAASWIYEFYMPLFFVVAGYLCGRLNLLATPRAALRRAGKLARDYFRGCGVLFLLWFVLFPLRQGDFSSVGRMLYSIAYGRFADPANPLLTGACWTGPLWFLTLMAVSQLLLFWLSRWEDGTVFRRVLLVFALLAAAQLLRRPAVLLPWCVDTAPMAALLLLTASWLGKARLLEKPWQPNRIPVLVLLAAAFILLHDTYDLHRRYYGRWEDLRGTLAFFAAGFCGSILFLLLCRGLVRCKALCAILTAAGRSSLAIFIGHTFVIWLVDGVFLRLPAFPGSMAVRAVLVLLAGSILPAAGAAGWKRLRRGKH